MKHKNTTIIILIITLLLTISTCGIFAYLSDSASETNILTVGDNNTKISEVFTPPTNIKPGNTIKKEVAVLNEGSVPCYVRVAILISNKNMEKNIKLSINENDWVAKGDGYYYYIHELPVGQKTPNLLNSVSISNSISANDIENFEITIYSESIQKENNNNYVDAWNSFDVDI